MGIYAEKFKDILAFGDGTDGRITNDAIRKNLSCFMRFNTPEHQRFKRDYFTVILHGWVNGTSGWDAVTLCSEIKKYWNDGRDRRAVCLLSCLTGYGMARSISKSLMVPVVAPQSFAYINQVGQFISTDWDDKLKKMANLPEGYIINEQPRWIFCDMKGNIKPVSDYPVLQFKPACEMAEKWINS